MNWPLMASTAASLPSAKTRGNIVEKATGETVAKLRKGGYSGRELLGWLGY